jgi:hypothetical protein
MRILKNKTFSRQAEYLGLTDDAVCQAVDEVRRGSIDARLGGNLIKKRVAIGAKGKSGGLRTILVYEASAENIFCIYVFGKNEKDNITADQLVELKLLAKAFLVMDEDRVKKAMDAGELIKVVQHGEDDKDNEKTNDKSGSRGDETSRKSKRKEHAVKKNNIWKNRHRR